MEKEQEVIENLFDDGTTEMVNNETSTVDLPSVAPENPEVQVFDNPFGVPLMEESKATEQSNNEEKLEDTNNNISEIVENESNELQTVTSEESGVAEEEPVVESNEINEEQVEVSSESLNKEVLEHPDAKIRLNNEQEETIDKKELEELKDVKLMDNSSLKFVLILGIILLIVIFLIPTISKYI